MSESVKVLQVGAFQLEAGLAGASQSPGWGQSGSVELLSTGDAFPWLTFGKGKTVNNTQDNSITPSAFKSIPRKVGEYVEKSFQTNQYLVDGMNRLDYWSMGFENVPIRVCVFVLTTPTIEPTGGAVYDTEVGGTGNEHVFMRKEGNYHIFTSPQTVPVSQTGSLYKQSGTGDATLSYTAHSVLMYEHLYELDPVRHLAEFDTDEQITGWSSGDMKNRMATLGIKMGTNDFRYPNAMCRGFAFKSSAGGLSSMNYDFLAYDEERGDYSSASWTLPSDLESSNGIAAHYQLKLEIGTSESALVSLGATDVSYKCDIPIQNIQDTVSGINIAEPVLEDLINIDLEATLSRYSNETYQSYRDSWTSVVARVSSSYGYYMREALFHEAKIETSGADDSGVAQEPLKLVVGTDGTNNWSTWLQGNTLIKKGSMVMRVRNTDSINYMFSI